MTNNIFMSDKEYQKMHKKADVLLRKIVKSWKEWEIEINKDGIILKKKMWVKSGK